jgi:MFS transporter, OPA family, glycerol-3-phosphate transporter
MLFGTILVSNGLSSLATYGLSVWSLDHFGWRFVFLLPVITILPAIAVFAIFAHQHLDYRSDPISPWASASVKRNDSLSLLKKRDFLLSCGSIRCESVARYGLLVWVPIYLFKRDWHDIGQGKRLMMLLSLGMAIGALFAGFFSDTIFQRNRVYMIILQMLLATVMVIGLSHAAKAGFRVCGTLLLLAGFNVYGPQAAYWAVGLSVGGSQRRGLALGQMDSSAYLMRIFGRGLHRMLGSSYTNYFLYLPGNRRSLFFGNTSRSAYVTFEGV